MKKLLIAAGLVLVVSPCYGIRTELDLIKTEDRYPVQKITLKTIKTEISTFAKTVKKIFTKQQLAKASLSDDVLNEMTSPKTHVLKQQELYFLCSMSDMQLCLEVVLNNRMVITLDAFYSEANSLTAISKFMHEKTLSRTIRDNKKDFIMTLEEIINLMKKIIIQEGQFKGRNIFDMDTYKYAMERFLTALEEKKIFETVFKDDKTYAPRYIEIFKAFGAPLPGVAPAKVATALPKTPHVKKPTIAHPPVPTNEIKNYITYFKNLKETLEFDAFNKKLEEIKELAKKTPYTRDDTVDLQDAIINYIKQYITKFTMASRAQKYRKPTFKMIRQLQNAIRVKD